MHDLTTERAQFILQTVAPGYELVSVKSAFGSFTNDVRILSCVSPEGQVRRLVVKFMVDQPEYSARNAVAHYHALRLVREHGIPAPEPIYMDETGQILGAPGLVMGFIPGKQVADPVDPEAWARTQEKDMDNDVKRDLTVIMNEAERASKITEGLLSFSGQRPTSRASISVNEAIESVLNLRAPQLKANNIQVVLKLHQDLPGTWADYQQIQQVLLNLVVNAEQAMTEAHNRGKLTVSTQHVDSVIRTTISDDGPGIPEHLTSKIFDPFYTTKRPGEGTGLGLSICHGIISEHGGVIQIQTQEDKGTTVVMELPVDSQGLAPLKGRQIQRVA